MYSIPITLTLHLALDSDGQPLDAATIAPQVNSAIFDALSESESLADLISDHTGWLVSSYTLEQAQ